MSRYKAAFLAVGSTPLVYFGVTTTLNSAWPDVYYSMAISMDNAPPSRDKVVVIGSGWGSISLLARLHWGTDVTVITPRPFFFYTPLLAGTTTGSVKVESVTESLRRFMSRFETGRVVRGRVVDVEFDGKDVLVDTGDEVAKRIPYDSLVFAHGAGVNNFGIPGVAANCLYLKEIEDGLAVKRKICDALEKASGRVQLGEDVGRLLNWVVIGAGPTGVELTAELNDFVNNDVKKFYPELADKVTITLVEAGPRILGMFDKEISRFATERLENSGVNVRVGAMVQKVGSEDVTVVVKKDGAKVKEVIDHGLAVWAGGVKPRELTLDLCSKIGKLVGGEEQLAKPVRGFKVDGDFKVKGVDGVYAIGDCASVPGCAPTAQAAYQHGMWLGRFLRKKEGETCEPFEFVNAGALAYVGAGEGVAELKSSLWDKHPNGEDKKTTIVEGAGAFAIWRSLYFSKLLSTKNMCMVAFDWMSLGMGGGRSLHTEYIMEEKADAKKAKK